MMHRPKVYLRERLYIPRAALTPEIKANYSVVLRDYLPEVNEQTGEMNECRDVTIKGWKTHNEQWASVARGDLDQIWSDFADRFEIVDQRSVKPLSFDLQWKGVLLDDGKRAPLRPSQTKFVNEQLAKGYGLGEAPPRFGKTISMTAEICEAKLKTLVIAHQIELCEQFESEFRRCTNVNEMEAQEGRRLVGICRSLKDFQTTDVCITTWQRFHASLPANDATPELAAQQMARRKTILNDIKILRNEFGMQLTDEAHRASAPCFSSVVSQFNPWYRFGVTATPDRKDQLDAVIKLVSGPVVTVGDEAKVLLRVRPVFTGFNPKFKQWYAYESAIQKDGRRNKMALDLIEKDVKAGHSVIVVCNRREHILNLVEALMKRDIIAEGFHAKNKDRKGVLVRAKSGHTKVVVAMRSMLLGINVPCWSAMHVLVPSANPPNYYQEISRVRTPFDGKHFAVVRDYIDACGAANGCYRHRHRVYTDPAKAPILFEDQMGNPVKKISCEYITTQASNERQAHGRGKAEFDEAQVAYGTPRGLKKDVFSPGSGGANGPRVPNFGWGGFAEEGWK